MSDFDTNNASTEAAPTANGTAARHMAHLAQPTDVETGEPRRKRHRGALAVLFLLALLAVAYVGGAIAFSSHFLPETTLNGEDVSLRSVDEVAAQNAASASTFGLSVKGDGIELSLTADDILARYDGRDFARTAIGLQNPWRWPIEILRTHSMEVESKLLYDKARLADIVGSAVDAHNKDADKPEDAKISYDKKKARYKVKEAKLGSTIDRQAAIKAVRAAIKARKDSVELGEDVLVKPEVTSDDPALNEAVDTANGYLSATQTLTVAGDEVAAVGEELLHGWIVLSDDLELTFDDDACKKWAQGTLSEQLDSYGSTRRYTRPDGKEITVSGGTYGWIIDGADIAARIAENVRAGVSGTVEVSFRQEAASWNPGGKDWGDKYIDVDLGEQHVRYYDGSKIIWESDCVSGGMDDRGEMHATPTGVFFINDNMRSGHIKLTGKIDPKTKKPIYISYVDYWMVFEGDSVALHDADWRSAFGGEIYKTNGSHGCVNLPVDKAKELYGMVSVGTVVVVHG